MTKKLVGLAALFAAGLLLAGVLTSVGVADITTTETQQVTTTLDHTTTTPAQTVVSTIEQTTTRKVIVNKTTPATTSSETSSNSTPTWVWVVLAILAAAVIGLIVALATRGRGGLPDDELQRRLEAAVASWTTQGWALESQRPGEAILRRGPEVMAVGIDANGQITTRPLSS